MERLTPSFLLANPDLVRPEARWCVALDNLELGLLALTQPWVAGAGLRRAEAERQISRLATELPVGPVYFQRVRRALAHLEGLGAVRVAAPGRGRRFVATPEGFAALILNLQVVAVDPTLDGSEFELKRALVALCNLVLDRLSRTDEGAALEPSLEGFFAAVGGLRILGRPVMTDEVMTGAFDVLGLIDAQRALVRRLASDARALLEHAHRRADLLRRRSVPEVPGSLASLGDAAAHALLTLAVETVPVLGQRARLLRYQMYLEYLDRLQHLYARELGVVDLSLLRRVGRA